MKNVITFSIICIITSIFFSSCSSNISIAKRHFNNGYYIAYSKDKQVVHTPKEEVVVQTKARNPFYSVQDKAEQNTIGGSAAQSPVTSNNDVVASNEKTEHKTISKQNIKQALKQNIKIMESPAIQIKHSLFKTEKISGDPSHDNDGLSLFWVVILVILILWALGFWGFGLVSGLMNLLLLVALILLILWLLKVI